MLEQPFAAAETRGSYLLLEPEVSLPALDLGQLVLQERHPLPQIPTIPIVYPGFKVRIE